jgi:heat shock protein HslJ
MIDFTNIRRLALLLAVTTYMAIGITQENKPQNPGAETANTGHEVQDAMSVATRGLIDGFELHGDLDDDGAQEIVLALWDSSQGSGLFNYLLILDVVDGKVSSQSIFIGDRIHITGGDITGNKISVDLIEHADTDPACCPSQKVMRTWEYGTDAVVREMPVNMKGELSVDDLSGMHWLLSKVNNEPVSRDTHVDLVYDEGRIKGNAGCNSYFSDMKDLEDAPAGVVKIGPVGSTRKMCADDIMKFESEYLHKLGNVTRFSLSGRQLILSWNVDDKSGALIFDPVAGGK